MAYLMATEQHAHDVAGGSVSYTSNLGCTKARASAIGCLLNSPSSGYDSNQLVRYDDLYKPAPQITYHPCSINYSGITITDSFRIYGAPTYKYDGTTYNMFQTTDFPPGQSYTNNLTLPPGVSTPFTITTDMFSAANGSFAMQGGSVNSSSAPSYLTFVSRGTGGNGGYVTYVRNSAYSGGASYTYYDSSNFLISGSMTVTIKTGYGPN